LIGLVGRIIHHAVTLVVEASRRFWNLLGDGNKSKTQDSRSNEEPHGFCLLDVIQNGGLGSAYHAVGSEQRPKKKGAEISKPLGCAESEN
jgi:hypothetical protein